jgi:hypothetical protein
MKTTDSIQVSEFVLWEIRAALLDAIFNPEPDEGLASAEHALALVNNALGI